MRIDLNGFIVLQAVVEQGSFAKAGQSLNMAQSAISYQIKRLEERLNLTLFNRNQYRATLTAEGKALWQESRHLLASLERIASLSRNLNSGWEADLNIVIDGALPTTPILKALQNLQQQSVPTRFTIATAFLQGVRDAFDQGKADIMLVTHFHPTAGLIAHPLPTTQMMLVAASDHPLANLVSVQVKDLQPYTELVVGSSLHQSNQHFNYPVMGAENTMLLSDFDTKKQALLMGLGFGWIPQRLIADELKQGKLVQIKYAPGAEFELRPHLVYHAEKQQGKATQLFTRCLLEQFQA